MMSTVNYVWGAALLTLEYGFKMRSSIDSPDFVCGVTL